jgi:hypothetical protein
MMLAALFGAPCVAGEDSSASSEATKSLAGLRVNIDLRSGKTLKDVTIDEARPGKIPGTFSNLRVTNSETGGQILLGASAIVRVSGVDGKCYLIFDTPSKALAPPDPAGLEAIHKAAAAAGEKPATQPAHARKNGHAGKNHTTRSKRGAETAADAEARRKENEAKRQAYFQKTGVWLWPEVTDEEQAKGVAKQKEFLRKVNDQFSSLHLRLYETQYFLFLSDLPPQWVKLYTSCLDTMYDQLCAAYQIKDRDHVWLGKLPVVAFSDSTPFEQCEKTFFGQSIDGKTFQGLAHKAASGEVVVTCHCGKDPYYFAAVLVHETTHGFTHRYVSGVQLPSWLDEGISEWSAMNVVHKDTAVLRKVQAGVARAKMQGNLGGNFFTDGKIQPWQYGIATGMVSFLQKSNVKSFRKMVNSIKMGSKWQDALQGAYRATPAQLTAAFGQSVGIPNLQP